VVLMLEADGIGSTLAEPDNNDQAEWGTPLAVQDRALGALTSVEPSGARHRIRPTCNQATRRHGRSENRSEISVNHWESRH
jgi:hypothetical protein